MAAVTSS